MTTLTAWNDVRAQDGKKPAGRDGGSASADLEIGQPAPEFTLKNHDGEEFKLADYQDKIVVLEWISKDCPVCKKYCEKMKALAAKYADKGVVWLAIDSTHFHKAEDNVAYAKERKISYPILSDFDGTVGRQYRAKTTPHMFVIHKGKLAYRGAIANEAGDRKYVEAAVDALLDGKPVATDKTRPFG
jgi:peroxiredoxin